MEQNKDDEIRSRAYRIWEDEGRPEGRHDDHWERARQEGSDPSHTGMLGDGTEEQNLDQPGNPDARITQDEVEEAFSQTAADKTK